MSEVDQLLTTLEALTHSQRMWHMVGLGREGSAAAVVAALEQGDWYHRLLALQSCYGSQDGGHALRALSDSSRIVSRRAVRLVAAYSDDAPIAEVSPGLRPELRVALLQHLRRRGRLTVIDACLDAAMERDPSAAASLIPFASEALVVKHFQLGSSLGGELFWSRLARRHPGLTVDRLTAAIDADERDYRLRWAANAVASVLSTRFPDRAVRLAEALVQRGWTSSVAWTELARHRPREIADLLVGIDDAVRADLSGSADRLDTPRLLALLARQPQTLPNPTRWFPRLPAGRRGDVYRHSGRLWAGADGRLDSTLVAALPEALRQREGRRQLELPAVAADPAARLGYAAFVPWAQARNAVEPYLNDPDAELRSAALRALVGASRFDRSRLGEVLDLLDVRTHEQDPVRCAFLAALVQLPPGRWEVEHLAGLDRVLRSALSAADLSTASAMHAQRLVLGILRRHPEWSVGWLTTLAKECGQLVLPEEVLTDADVRHLAPSLTPVLAGWQAREREQQLVQLARTLRHRLSAFDELVALLIQVLRYTTHDWVAVEILYLLKRYRGTDFAALVPQLIGEDPSWVIQWPVLHFLHHRRQDLLTPLLGQHAYRGRFATGKTRPVLPLGNGFFRWTPTQQQQFAATLGDLIADPDRDTFAVCGAIRQLAALPAVEVTRLAELSNDTRPAVRDTAIRALGRLDGGQGAPILLAALRDDRAQIAVYALRGTVLAMPSRQAAHLLTSVPLTVVTVAKQVVRLLGELPGSDGLAELQRLDQQPLHRDVRVALLWALERHLERPEAWQVLDRAVDSGDPVLLAAVVRTPVSQLSAASHARLAALLARILGHTDPTVRTLVLRTCATAPPSDRDAVLLSGILSSLRSAVPTERSAAGSALFTMCLPADAERIAAGIRAVMTHRRALVAAIEALQAALPGQRSRLTAPARAVLDVLTEDVLAVHLRLQLAARVLSWDEFGGLCEALVTSDELDAEALATAVAAVRVWTTRPDRDDLEALESRLAAHTDACLRRLALAALIAQAALPGGWSAERLERLRGYRSDSSPLVAAVAQFTLPAEEEDRLPPLRPLGGGRFNVVP